MKTNQFTKKRLAQRRVAILGSILLMMALALACGGSSSSYDPLVTTPTFTRVLPTKTPYITATVPSSDILTVTASALQAHTGAIRFLTYKLQGNSIEKVPDITTVLQAYNADVLAIQETNGWNADDFAIVKQMAADLGMEYIYCRGESSLLDKNGNTYDMVVMSKLEIKSSETYTDVHNCLVRVEVASPGGQSVQVFATFIRPEFDKVGCQNIEKLVGITEPFMQDIAVLMGSMNMPSPGIVMGYPENQIKCPPMLVDAGWTHFTADSQVDQIWGTQALLDNQSYKLPGVSQEPLAPKKLVRSISEHSPLAVDFYIP